MAVFLVDAEVLAHARFGTSQLAECVAGLNILLRPQPLPWHRTWRDRHVADFRRYLSEDPVTASVAAHAFSATWAADFLTVPPLVPDLTLDQETAELETLSDQRIRGDLEQVRVPLAPKLSASGLASRVAGLVRWVWTHTIAPEWDARRRVLRADVVSRTSRLGEHGWSGVLDDLRPGMRWLGDGRLRYDARPYPDIDIRGQQLSFFAAHCRGGWVTWRHGTPAGHGIVYPVTGIFADEPRNAPDSLTRLLGGARATILLNASEPASTSTLVATTGMPLGTVGSHLRILLDAGLLQRRRSGREVLYWWTDSARALHDGARP